MGEFIRLSYEERKRPSCASSRGSAGRPILAGAAEPNVELVLEMCPTAPTSAAARFPSPAPYYYKLTQESIEAYFREIAAKSPIDIVVYNIPVFANEISLPVLEAPRLDCPRIVGTKDTSKDMGRFQQTLHTIKRQRPDFSVLIGWEELLCTGLFMGADGGTLSSAGVVPEVVMKLYRTARAGNWDEARRIQFELLDLFSLMVGAPNFPEGFRSGYELRGFKAGHARFPLSPAEQGLIAEMRSKLACVLADCGFCGSRGRMPRRKTTPPMNVDAIVQAVLRKHRSRQAR
jgi:2-dehydro-3-deoxy-D-pentonate aldolase